MLQDEAMLIRLSLSSPSPFKRDVKLSSETAERHSMRHDSINTNKRLYPKVISDQWEHMDTKIRSYVKQKTRPWFDEGWRVLPVASYFEVMDKVHAMFQEREIMMEAIALSYDQIKQMKLAESDAYRESDYPADIRSKFSHEVTILPIPREGDFRCNISDQDKQQIEQDYLKLVEDQLSSKYLWELIRKTMTTQSGTLDERLRQYTRDSEGRLGGRFYDSLIENVRELVQELPNLNIGQDPDITAITQELAEVAQHDPDLLRENEVLREDTAAKAEQILRRISGFM